MINLRNNFYRTQLSKMILPVAVLCAVLLAACNSVNDVPDPVVLPDVPPRVLNMFNQRFPDATETTMRVVEKDKLWEADFKINSERFYAAMDTLRILRRVRLENKAVPDSIQQLLANSVLAGVQLQDYQEQLETFYQSENMYTARYRLLEKDYRVNWFGNLYTYMLRSERYYKFAYAINSEVDLPPKVRAVMEAEPLKYFGGLVFVNDKNEKWYQVNGSNGDGLPGGDYVFDTSGTLIMTNYKPEKNFASVDEVPQPVREYLNQLDAAHGFKFQIGYKMRLTGGYWFFLSNSRRESLELVLDADGKEIDRLHTQYIN